MGPEKPIRENLQEYYALAKELLDREQYNASTVLFYKALVQLCDLALYQRTGRIGTSHTDRFRLLEKHEPRLYATARTLFAYYRDSYDQRISKAIAEEVEQRVTQAYEAFDNTGEAEGKG